MENTDKASRALQDANCWCGDLLRILFECGAIDPQEAKQNGVEEALQARAEASEELVRAVTSDA